MQILSLFVMVLQGAGYTPAKLKKLAADQIFRLGKEIILKIMTKGTPEIAAKAQKEGWLVGAVKPTTANPAPHALTEHEVVRDILFREWRHVFAVHGAGHVADAFRDGEEAFVGAAVEPGWDGSAATYEQMVQAVAEAAVQSLPNAPAG